jgi:hypothetical protein
MNPGAPAARPRPTTVTVSSYLLMVAAAVSLLNAVLSLSTIGTVSRVAHGIFDDSGTTDGDVIATVSVAGVAVGATINIIFAGALLVLALINNRGRNASRITTWVLGGISLCCTGAGLAGTAASSSFGTSAGGESAAQSAELERQLEESLPSWWGPVTTTSSVIVLLAILVALILLALPASNEYFRKPQATWTPQPGFPTPPYPGQQPPYPGQPQQPPYPGQQYPGQAPPYPGQQPYQPGQPDQGGTPPTDPPTGPSST